MEFLTHAVLELSASPWIPLIVLTLVLIDGFFPPVPGEAVLVAVSAIAVSTGTPALWLVLLAGGLGAAIGDNIAYAIGRRVGTDRFRWMRLPRVRRAIAYARFGLRRRGALLILGGRYIPVGRLAINMTAGATRFPRSRFVPLSILGGMLWSAQAVLIGVIAGSAAARNPLLGAAIGIGISIVLALVIEGANRVFRAARTRRTAREQAASFAVGQLRPAAEARVPALSGPVALPRRPGGGLR